VAGTALHGTIVAPSLQGVLGALISLIAIFLPGVLVLIGALPLWETFRRRTGAQAIMRRRQRILRRLLGAALYNPIWTSAVKAPVDFGLALTGFVLLIVLCAPPLIVVLISAAGGVDCNSYRLEVAPPWGLQSPWGHLQVRGGAIERLISRFYHPILMNADTISGSLQIDHLTGGHTGKYRSECNGATGQECAFWSTRSKGEAGASRPAQVLRRLDCPSPST
jgi:hypothetical protein